MLASMLACIFIYMDMIMIFQNRRRPWLKFGQAWRLHDPGKIPVPAFSIELHSTCFVSGTISSAQSREHFTIHWMRGNRSSGGHCDHVIASGDILELWGRALNRSPILSIRSFIRFHAAHLTICAEMYL